MIPLRSNPIIHVGMETLHIVGSRRTNFTRSSCSGFAAHTQKKKSWDLFPHWLLYVSIMLTSSLTVGSSFMVKRRIVWMSSFTTPFGITQPTDCILFLWLLWVFFLISYGIYILQEQFADATGTTVSRSSHLRKREMPPAHLSIPIHHHRYVRRTIRKKEKTANFPS